MILLKPLITEKTMRLAQAGQFTFSVRKGATKPAIARAAEEQFKVNVTRVTTSKTKGKARRTGEHNVNASVSGLVPARFCCLCYVICSSIYGIINASATNNRLSCRWANDSSA